MKVLLSGFKKIYDKSGFGLRCFSLFLCLFFFSINSKAQNKVPSGPSLGFDTTNLKIQAYPPGNPDYSECYRPRIYAYSYKNGKLINYNVRGFDLIYSKPGEEIRTASSNDANLTTFMLGIITKSDTSLSNLYLDNVLIEISSKKVIKIIGMRQLNYKR
ncbi:MAG TPA: hypothetical protein VHK91_09560 [Flavisolibacter sp.]|jgi:hypothetical protein|nr:hypothetical protein [Flavisolibacter sp.]